MGNSKSCGCDSPNQVDNSHELTPTPDDDEATKGLYESQASGAKKTVEFDVPSGSAGRQADSDFSGSYTQNALHAGVRISDAARTSTTEDYIENHPRDTFEPSDPKEAAVGKSYTATFTSKKSVNIEEDMKTLQAFLEEHNFKNVNHNRSNEKKLPCCGERIGSPLHKAVEAENMELIRILLERGASLSALDSRKQTPRAIAIRLKLNPELIRRLNPGIEGSPFLKKKSPK